MIVGENCAVLGYYAASNGNFLPTFRDNVSVLSSRVKDSNFLDSRCVVIQNSAVLICFAAEA